MANIDQLNVDNTTYDIMIKNTLAIDRGGTGATNVSDARTNLGAAAISHTHNVSDLSGILPIANGGTGANDVSDARNNLGITPANIGASDIGHTHSASDITSGILSTARGGLGNSSGYVRTGLANLATAGNRATIEGYSNFGSGVYAHAEGNGTSANAEEAHTEGLRTLVDGSVSHAEGYMTSAHQPYSHTEGYKSITVVASGSRGSESGHAEGDQTTAIGVASHSEGSQTCASGYISHSEGYQTTAEGKYSHAGGRGTIAKGNYQTAIGYFNVADNDSLFIVGNGDSNSNRNNAFSVYYEGGINIGTTGPSTHKNGDIWIGSI